MTEKNEIVIYTTPEGNETFEVNIKKDTVWLSQKQMAELFEKNTDTIGLYIKNIFSTKELDKESTTEEYSVVQTEGGREVKRKIKFYNLDLIISVGYRVNSKRGTQFRIWATNVLKEHLTKGYAILPPSPSEQYIRVLTEKTSIPASKKKPHTSYTLWLKIIPL